MKFGLKVGDEVLLGRTQYGDLCDGISGEMVGKPSIRATIVGYDPLTSLPMAYIHDAIEERGKHCGYNLSNYIANVDPAYSLSVDPKRAAFWVLGSDKAFTKLPITRLPKDNQQQREGNTTMSNPFRIGDAVSKRLGTTKLDGVVKYTTCYGATHSGGKTCSHRNCPHSNIKDYVWVEWLDGTLYSYKHNELLTAEDKILDMERQKEKTMSEKPSFMEETKSEAVDALYRVAGNQMTKGTKAGLLKLLEKQGHNSTTLAALSEFFDTEIGSAFISYGLGIGLKHAPMLSEDARAQKLAKEFRTQGFATVGNQVFGMAMEYILPAVQGALATLPKEEKPAKARIAEGSKEETNTETEEHEETDTVVKAAKAMKA